MTDAEARALERAWRQDPTDPHAARRALDAFARAGQLPPRELADGPRHGPRRVSAPERLAVWAVDLDGEERELGRTGPGFEAIDVPPCRVWGVTGGLGGGAGVAATIARELAAPGLRLVASEPGLAALEDLPRLESLELPALPGTRGWPRIAQLEALERVVVRPRTAVLQGEAVHALAALPRLRHASLGSAARARQVAPILTRASLLESLDVLTSARDLTLFDLARLPGAERLSSIAISALGPRPAEALAALPRLRSLHVAGDISNDHCDALARARGLERLVLDRCGPMTVAGLASLATLPALRDLCLGGVRLSWTGGLACLRELPLRQLRLSGRPGFFPYHEGVDDRTLGHAFPHPTLQRLEVDGEVTGRTVIGAPALRHVALRGQLRGDGLAALAQAPLESLEVQVSAIEPGALRSLGGLPSLLRLAVDANHCREGSELTAGDLAALSLSPRLRELTLANHARFPVPAHLDGCDALERVTLHQLPAGAVARLTLPPRVHDLGVDDSTTATEVVGLARSLPHLRVLRGVHGAWRDVVATALPHVWVE